MEICEGTYTSSQTETEESSKEVPADEVELLKKGQVTAALETVRAALNANEHSEEHYK